MPIKELWIHAGLPKCGSSALQVFFASNKKKLESISIDYPELEDLSEAKGGGITSGNGAQIARSMLSPTHEAFYPDPASLFDRLISHIRQTKSDKVLISSEFFAVVPVKRIVEFKSKLTSEGFHLRYCYYVRRQDQFLISNYLQRVKRHGYSGYPDEFVRHLYKNVFFLKYYGYANHYVKTLGKDSVLPRVYEVTKRERGGIAGDFVKQLTGEIPEWIEPPKSINTSPSPQELKILLASNKYHPRMKFSDFIIENSALQGRSKEYSNHQILPYDVVQEVMLYFSEQNQKFFEEFSHLEKFELVTEGEFLDLRNISFGPEEIADIFAGLLVRFDKRIAQLEKKKESS